MAKNIHSNPSPLGERARELVEQFPSAATKTLARILSDESNGTLTVDQARSRIRYYRGQSGVRHRREAGIKEAAKPERAKSPPALPQPRTEFTNWAPQRLRARRVLVLADIHTPFYDKTALELALNKGEEMGVDAILLNGDFMDFYTISRWLKDPRERDFKGEIEMGREVLQYLRERFKGAQIWWKIGNHEERWEAYMWTKAPELAGIEDFHVESWMRCAQWNVRVVRDMQPIKINNLNVLHGHEYRFSISNPVNPARGIYLRAKVPAIIGHLHQTSEHTETNLNGTICTCWSQGCLCDLRPSYSPLNKWNHGFTVVDTTGEDDFTVHNFRIWKGRIL